MRSLLLIFLLTQSAISYAQFYVGDSKELTISLLELNDIPFTQSELSDTTSRISWLYENDYQMILVLNNQDIVTVQTLIPESQNGVNEFVKWFNKDFVIISDTEWKNYTNGKIYNIQLRYLLLEPIFSISLSPDSKN